MEYLERNFEEAIENHLLSTGYTNASSDDYDPKTGFFKETLFQFIQHTQKNNWEKLENFTGSNAKKIFLDKLIKDIDQYGLIDTLRKGIEPRGISFKLIYFMPSSKMNIELIDLYEQNMLTVTRQMYFSAQNKKSLDMVLSINGIPIITMELKNGMTGQTVEDAKMQYKKNRDPKELIFQFNKRSLVHFAVDSREVHMTTKLQKEKTSFLPFNRGYEDGAGNPINENGYRTSYLWEEVLEKESLLDIIHRFIHKQEEKLIFPRFHQLSVVRSLVDDIQVKGTGVNYLIQHSAGSGKSNSISWLAHRLSSLHDGTDKAIFDSVIVVTDRRVLDKQIKNTIKQFEQTKGVVEWAERGSSDLVKHLEDGVKIIITTIQKFPHAVKKMNELKDKNYAVIIDEAHSSQSGEGAKALREVLGNKYVENESDTYDAIQTIINEKLTSEGKQQNISFFAFTATPKKSTLEMFGTKNDPYDLEEKPTPFHVYSMKQAIEEKFILDVLENYTTYDVFYKINQSSSFDPEVDKKKAKREILHFVSKNALTIESKIKIIVEHYRESTRFNINGKAKAMIVTSSREAAVLMKKEFDRYCHSMGYHDTKAIVAFSGEINGETESMINGFPEGQLPQLFSSDKYQVLIAADKYQTGFDEPLLQTMYVDKALKGVNAVQTLSRLNRTHPEKKDTFVIDFWNDTETIKDSFQPFYQTTSIDENTDPEMIFDIKRVLDDEYIYYRDEITEFCRNYFDRQKGEKHSSLDRLIQQSYDRFKKLNDEKQEVFKINLKRYIKLYGYLTQIMNFDNQEMFELFIFGNRLYHAVSNPYESGDMIDISEDIHLMYFHLKKEQTEHIKLENKNGEVVEKLGIGQVQKNETAPLSQIIDYINSIFSEEFGDDEVDLLEDVTYKLTQNDTIRSNAVKNKVEDFLLYTSFNDFLGDILDDYNFEEYPLLKKMESNDEVYTHIYNAIGKEVYHRVHGS